MNSEHLSSPAVWFEQFVHRYRDEKGKLPFALELKRAHCLRVAENARTIAGRLSQPKEKPFWPGSAVCCTTSDAFRNTPVSARFMMSTRSITGGWDSPRWKKKGLEKR